MTSPQLDNTGTPSLSDAINKLMANPEIISMVASSLGDIAPPPIGNEVKEEKEKTTSPPVETEQASLLPSAPPQNQTASPDLGELIKGLSPMMSMLRGSAGGGRSNERREERREADKREALLCALKPYVSDGRREAIDYIIRISQVSDILKNIQKQP